MVDLAAAVVVPVKNPAASPVGVKGKSTARLCNNRFDMLGFQVDKYCVRCLTGTHENEGKCVSNLVGCAKKTLVSRKYTAKKGAAPVVILGNCSACKFTMWATVSNVQGNYCYNRWWMWVIIIVAVIVGLTMLVSAVAFFACCDDCCSKKQSKKSSKGQGGEVNVQNKKPKDEKKSSGCCGGDKKVKKAKGEESYDKGYEKPGICDCMCLANTCGGCLGACGCTCSKCCRKKDRYVSGYGLANSQHH